MKYIRHTICALLAALLSIFLCLAYAQNTMEFAAPPSPIRPGKLVLLRFSSAQAGYAQIALQNAEAETVAVLYSDYPVTVGENNIGWDGMSAGSPIPPGQYTLTVKMGSALASTLMTIGDPAPIIKEAIPADSHLVPGMAWQVLVTTTQEGLLQASLLLDGQPVLLHSSQVKAGETAVSWDGTIGGAPLPPGSYTVMLQLTDATGFAATPLHLDVEIVATKASHTPPSSAPAPVDAPPDATPSSITAVSPAAFSPYPARAGENSYWTLPMDLRNEAAIWDVLMQPITVIKGHERESYALRALPDKSADAVGEVTYVSQGVRVLETLDNGWSLVESYSSSFAGSKVKVYGSMVQGYVPSHLLQTIQPSDKMGLVIDKLTQRLYIFSEGKLMTSLLISTGLANDKQPYNETQAGEYLLISKVGRFLAENLICEMGIRFNDGNYIHQVPFITAKDGSKFFGNTEPKLGAKASHGCVRVQRKANPEGVNMTWLWNNYKKNTKLLIWEDYKGRQLEIPENSLALYYNNDGGKYYHSVDHCRDVREKYLPLTGFTYGQLEDAPFSNLLPCLACGPVRRIAEIEKVNGR